ncbi:MULTISPECIES: CaiB/BaiF CoA transferase family protein [unclassified Plantibacter]|uniref:CaiB/BaiF CoA transferase family protein n=1 Tax=unclassified Plantibacter TaxID=2624265 RepID=UPI003D335DFC
MAAEPAAAPSTDAAPPTDAAPLAGVLVADFSRVLAGPLAAMTLADLGATVVKVERPGTGDDTRAWGPPYGERGATYFESVNRNKQSIALDLTDPEDLATARELALRADVLIENFRPGTLERLGLGHEELSATNPRLVSASISGFGSGAGASLPGYDFVVQAVGGLMHITGEQDGDPMKAGVALVDVLTGKDAVIAILAALQRRERTGHGSHVEVNLLSSLQGSLVNQAAAHLGAAVNPTRLGNVHPSIAPYQLLACADEPLAVACGNDGQFRALVTALDIPALADDARFATNRERVGHRVELVAALEAALASDSAESWQRRLTAVGVPVGVVADIPTGLAFAAELGLEPVIEVLDDTGEVVGRQVRNAISWTPSFPVPRQAPPALDADGARVRDWLR